MSEDEKKKIGQRLSTRVSTGLMFIEFNYLVHHEKPDAAWIRNIYILLSFYTELLLKAIYVAEKSFVDVQQLDEQLRKIGHNFVSAGQEIGKESLNKFGIQNIQFINHEYCVKTNDGDFFVKDFNDIRYDFIDGKMRTLNGNEHQMFKKQIEIMLKINEKLKPLVW
jgi:hypothetical protein